jgi:hypothetical protein
LEKYPGEAKENLEKNKDFRRWFHKKYKKDNKCPKGDRNNPDMDPDEIIDAWDEWNDLGRPNVK